MMPYLDDGSLRQRLLLCGPHGLGGGEDTGFGLCGLNFMLVSFYQVLQGVLAMHKRSLIHMDLKPDNIVLHQMGREAPALGIYKSSIPKGIIKYSGCIDRITSQVQVENLGDEKAASCGYRTELRKRMSGVCVSSVNVSAPCGVFVRGASAAVFTTTRDATRHDTTRL